MSNMSPVVHFEMPAEDLERMKAFYSKTFGWQANQMGADMGNYAVMHTTEVAADHFPKERGRINGGFYPKTDRAPYPSVVIAVDDIVAAMQRITDNGGKVLGEPVMIPGNGEYVSFFDSEGNRASIIKPLAM